MPIGKITLSAIDQLEPNSTLWDPHLKGFGVRKNPKRKATFVLKTQVNRRQSWITIGRLGQPWTVETARKEALRLLGEAASGVNITDKHGTPKRGADFEVVADEYLATHASKLKARTREVYATIVQKHLKPYFKGYSFDQIERRQIAKLHTSMAETPRNANHALAVLSSLMSWAEEYGYKAKESNPCLKIKKYREVKRKRYLSLDELGTLGQVIREAEEKGAHSSYTLAAIKLLLLTGARLTEILTLKWDYVDLYRGHFNLPDSKTGSKTIHLNQPAVDVLTKLPRLSHNPYVIVGLVEGAHLVNLQKPWRAIRKLAGLNDVRIHDLRHTFASFGVNNGASLAVVGSILGHASPQTTARYSHIFDETAAAAVQRTGAFIGDALSGKTTTREPSASPDQLERRAGAHPRPAGRSAEGGRDQDRGSIGCEPSSATGSIRSTAW